MTDYYKKFDESSKTLTIKCFGDAMELKKYKNKVEKVIFEDGRDAMSFIPQHSFNGFSKLKEVELPSNLTQIGFCAFNGCKELTKINTSNVKVLGIGAFNGCSKLTELDLTNVEEIGSSAFEGCSKLGKIKGLTKLRKCGPKIFEGCPEKLISSLKGKAKESLDYAFPVKA